MIILGIDTSCDETSASILKDGKILSNIVFSQHVHKKYGGVVPNLASKDHERNIFNTVNQSIVDANIKMQDIAAIAVTYSPGLISCLLVGLNFAKGLSVGLNIPLVAVNHLEGHLCSNFIDNDLITFPYICLLVSGGHTQIWEVVNGTEFNILSTTVDDAAGEAFDKGAKMLGLAYPGGPEIEKYAKNGDSTKYSFTVPRIKKNPLNFSFSGIKTALYYKIKEFGTSQMQRTLSDVCASYQDGILNILFDRLNMVLIKNEHKNISIVGGVACNKRFRDMANIYEQKKNVKFHFPDLEYCTDNGAMIAMAAYQKLKNQKYCSDINVSPIPNVKI